MTQPFPPPPVAATAQLLQALQAWCDAGWLRPLDSALAAFVPDLCPQSPPLLVLSAALVSQLEGQGHSCLALEELLRDPEALLGWPAAAVGALRGVLDTLPREPAAWQQVLRESALVGVPASPERPGTESADGAGAPPFVLCGSRLYLRRYWQYERQVAAQLRVRSAAPTQADEDAVRRWLDLLFPRPAQGAPQAGVDWQQVACAVALRGRLSVITGGPGTGKTHTAARLLALLLATHAGPQPLRVALAAPTGKAAARLRQAMGEAMQGLQSLWAQAGLPGELAAQVGAARTLHALLGARPDTRKFAFGPARTLALDVLIVDEASMVHLEMMDAVLGAMPAHARVVLLGDKDQLASVEAGAVLGELCRDAERGHYRVETAAFVQRVSGQVLPAPCVTGGTDLAQQTVMLRTSHRFSGAIGALALAVNDGDLLRAAPLLGGTERALARLQGVPAPALVELALAGRSAGEAGPACGYASAGGYLETLRQRPGAPAGAGGASAGPAFEAWAVAVLTAFERSRVLCAVRAGPWGTEGVNAAIEQALVARGWLVRSGPWYEGRPVMVTRNDPGTGVFNGDIGIVLRAPAAAGSVAPLRAYFLEGRALRSVGVGRLSDVETAFAMTVHKAQGSEFAHTVLVLPHEPSRVLTRELVYTAVTRARSAFTLVSPRAQALGEALARPTRRAGGLREMLEGPPGPGAGATQPPQQPLRPPA
jgi:exodeoxyribonuclease V alpha subunit